MQLRRHRMRSVRGALIGCTPDIAGVRAEIEGLRPRRRELQLMDPAKYEYQSEFAQRYVAQGKAEGSVEGRAALLTRLLSLRFGALPPGAHTRISTASIEELDAIGERLLTAQTLQEALGPR